MVGVVGSEWVVDEADQEQELGAHMNVLADTETSLRSVLACNSQAGQIAVMPCCNIGECAGNIALSEVVGLSGMTSTNDFPGNLYSLWIVKRARLITPLRSNQYSRTPRGHRKTYPEHQEGASSCWTHGQYCRC
ncbi:hypothetical protein CBL_03169 [Carabus blaptoides fortunei]